MALTAARSVTKARSLGAPLPHVPELAALYEGEFRFTPRRGEVTMIAGMPGSQKSGFALFLAARMGLPTLYFCADMAQHTAITRLAATMTGDDKRTVADGIKGDGAGYYEDAVSDIDIRFCYDPNPDMGTITGELDAWVEGWDEYPALIVVDNLLDVIPPAGDSEHAAYKAILLEIKSMARLTGAAVLILHHMSESAGDPAKPAPRDKILGKVAQTPENVLSIAVDGDEFRVSVVKQREGPTDAKASRWVSFKVEFARNRFVPWVPLDEHVAGVVADYWRGVR